MARFNVFSAINEDSLATNRNSFFAEENKQFLRALELAATKAEEASRNNFTSASMQNMNSLEQSAPSFG